MAVSAQQESESADSFIWVCTGQGASCRIIKLSTANEAEQMREYDQQTPLITEPETVKRKVPREYNHRKKKSL
jgi:hypothetical protein